MKRLVAQPQSSSVGKQCGSALAFASDTYGYVCLFSERCWFFFLHQMNLFNANRAPSCSKSTVGPRICKRSSSKYHQMNMTQVSIESSWTSYTPLCNLARLIPWERQRDSQLKQIHKSIPMNRIRQTRWSLTYFPGRSPWNCARWWPEHLVAQEGELRLIETEKRVERRANDQSVTIFHNGNGA